MKFNNCSIDIVVYWISIYTKVNKLEKKILFQYAYAYIEFVHNDHIQLPSTWILETPCGLPLLSVGSMYSNAGLESLVRLLVNERISQILTEPLADPALAIK